MPQVAYHDAKPHDVITTFTAMQ